MKRNILFSLLLILPLSAAAQTIIPGGPVSGTWIYAGSPYLVQGDIFIDETSTLEIEPGVEVLFQGYHRLLCEGQLLAIGAEADSITFTAEDTTAGWDGIDFVDLDLNPLDSSRVEYCVLSYGVASRIIGETDYRHGGALYIDNSSKIAFRKSSIRNNRTGDVIGDNGAYGVEPGDDGEDGGDAESGLGGAVYCLRSSPAFEECNFTNNRTGDAHGGEGGNGAESNTPSFSASGGDGGYGGEAITGYGGAIALLFSDGQLVDCVFQYNHTGSSYGGHGGDGGSAHCSNGNAYGGDGRAGGDATPGNGGVLYLYQCIPTVINNLLIENSSGSAFGGHGGWGGNAEAGWSFPNWNDAYGGDGGDGGDACQAQGCAIYADSPGNFDIYNITVSENNSGEYSAGYGGIGGWYSSIGEPGENGISGVVTGDSSLIGGSNLHLVNSILADNEVSYLSPGISADYTCSEYTITGTGNIDSDPLFLQTPVGKCFLSQTASGQPQQSPCVDAGCPDSTLIPGTTRSDGILDTGVIDMGFHYPVFTSYPNLVVEPAILTFSTMIESGNPPSQYVTISNNCGSVFNYTIETGAGWLIVEPASGGPIPPDDTLEVSVDISGLEGGIYQDEIIIESPEAVNSPQIVSVTLNLNFIDGEISGVLDAGTYCVDEYVFVPEEDSLMLEPGVTLLFSEEAYFFSYGFFSAQGTESDSIKFLPLTGADSWNGFTIDYDGADTVYFEYCRISGSVYPGFYLKYGNYSLNHCLISDNQSDYGGIHAHHCDLQLSESMVSGNSGGFAGGLYSYDSNVSIYNSRFIDNQTEQTGSGARFYDSNAYIVLSLFQANIASDDGACIYINDDGTYHIYNSTFSNNSINTIETESPVFIKNTIIEGSEAAGIILSPYASIVEYCNFFNNPVDCVGDSIIHGFGRLSFTNTNGDSCDVFSNIFLDPQFVDPVNGDFHLTENSPCIDAGDPFSMPDPDSTIADIGAYYFDQILGADFPETCPLPAAFSLSLPYPNPFNSSVTISFAVPRPGDVKITIYDIMGRSVGAFRETPLQGRYSAGTHRIVWNAAGSASGVYFVRMEAGDFRQTRKMLLLK